MKKEAKHLIVSSLLLIFCFYGFAPKKPTVKLKYLVSDVESMYTVLSKEERVSKPYISLSPVLTQKGFHMFKEALGFKESQNRYDVVNTFGYMGKYQFGRHTLALIGITDAQAFVTNAQMQEKAFVAYTSRNKWVLRRDISRYVGKRMNGVLITESGILAAAHLAGPGSVKRYLRSWGQDGFEDGFGTSIRHYMKKFGGYDMSSIPANRMAKVTFQ